VLADEPTGNLDSATGQAIMTLIDELHAEGATIVVITHEHEIAARIPRQITMLDGQIVTDSSHERDRVDGRPRSRRPPR
jgi:putative ABC transport system ATP-binding protein